MTRSIGGGSLREELGNNLQIGLGAGLIGGGLLGFLAAAATLALNPPLLHSAGDVIRILLGLQFVYALLCLALGLAGASIKTVLFLATGRQLSDTKTAAVLAGIGFFLLGGLYGLSWCRWQEIGGLAPNTPLRLRSLPVLFAIAAASALLARLMTYAFYILIVYVKKPERRRAGDLRRAYLVLLWMGGLFLLTVVVMRLAARTPADSGLTRSMVHPTGRQVLLLGVDGLDGGDVEWLRSEGLLSWAEPVLRGARGTIEVPPDPVPPIVWTEVATGRNPAAHGIVDYQAQVVKGLKTTLRIGPNQVGLFELFHTVLPFLHMTRVVPFKSYMRESKGLWNMATDARLRVVAVNWWISWPAERVRGAVVSDHAWLKLEADSSGAQTAARAAASVQTPEAGMIGALCPLRPDGQPLILERETWPPALLTRLSCLAGPTPPDTLAARYGPSPPVEALAVLAGLGIPADVVRSDLFYAQSAAWLLDTESPDLWMLHLPGPDIIRRVLEKRLVQPAERERARREALRAYWRTLDPALASCTSGLGSGSGGRERLMLWLSLPGKQWPDSGNRSGLFALAGGGAERSSSPRLTCADVAPTILWLLGLPASREMDGAPRTDLAAFTPPPPPVEWIPSYGRQETQGLEEAAGSLDQQMLERFHSLGYLH